MSPICVVLLTILTFGECGYLAEYRFFESTTIPISSSIGSSSTLPKYQSGPIQPSFDRRGMIITPGTYINSTDVFNSASPYCSAGFWLYYIQGTLGDIGIFKFKTMYEKIDVTLDAFQSGSNQLIRANLKGNYFPISQLIVGWNYIGFGFQLLPTSYSYFYFYYKIFQNKIVSNYATSLNTANYLQNNLSTDMYLGCQSTASDAQYIIYDLKVADDITLSYYGTSLKLLPPNSFVFCGDGVKDVSLNCDDGNYNTGDGCDSSCFVENGWLCSTYNSPQLTTCNTICGDGIVIPSQEACDDGNNDSGDGCSSTCQIEAGFSCVFTSSNYPSVCSNICGDGVKSSTENCDDGNLRNGDGCDANCKIEAGYTCTLVSPGFISTCNIKCGDGYIGGSEECDDNNEESGDGCSNTCKNETGFVCTSTKTQFPETKCITKCGDGLRKGIEECDDGNEINGDGCSNLCKVEDEYVCSGGTITTKDTCLIVCGDGISSSSDPTSCDDGNIISGDGCSSLCKIEYGFKCVHTSPSTPDTCDDICGDGINVKPRPNYCDDGNFQNRDGCNSNCAVEDGYTCSGGSSKHKDMCVENCGDGKDFGTYECDDGNMKDGDGCSSACEYEYCYACSGGTLTSPDKCYNFVISASIGEVSTSNSVLVSFNFTMLNSSIGPNDLLVTISGNYNIDFTWTAIYQSTKSLLIQLNANTVLQGSETLTIKFINSKVFRGPDGGCVQPNSLTGTMKSSLSSSTQSANAIGNLTQYFAMIGIVGIFGILWLLGSSFEMVWSLVNTLQLISYFPLMITFYPEHVTLMFQYLQFSNLDIQFISDFFKSLIPFDLANTPSFSVRFENFGIQTPLFIDNCASLLLSFIVSISTLAACFLLFTIAWCAKFKNFLGGVISSYFFNNFLRFITEGFLELFFGALLNVTSFNHSSPSEMISLSLAVIIFVICIVFPCITFAQLYDKRIQIRDENDVYLKKFGTMYRDFKTNKAWFHFQFYPLFMMRRMIFVTILILMTDYEQIQCNIFILLSILTLSYQIITKPFHHELINYLCTFNESILFSVSLIQNVFTTNIRSTAIINYSGWVMISMIITMIFVNFSIVLTHSLIKKLKSCNKSSNDSNACPEQPKHRTTDSRFRLTNTQENSSIIHF